jgi:hypothetical protein
MVNQLNARQSLSDIDVEEEVAVVRAIEQRFWRDSVSSQDLSLSPTSKQARTAWDIQGSRRQPQAAPETAVRPF